jgi:hypothetical protein
MNDRTKASGATESYQPNSPFARSRKHARKRPQKALAIGFVTGQEQVQTCRCLEVVASAAGRLAKTDAF